MTSRTIGDLIEVLIDYRGKTPPKSERGVPLITAKVIKGGRILSDGLEYIDELTYAAWMRRGLPHAGDVLITTEAPLGEVAQVPREDRVALAQRVILLRPDPSRVDPQFFFHFLRSPLARIRLTQRASGTTVSGIRQPELRSVEVDLLDRRAQRRVGQILDAFDGLIETDRKRIDLLDRMTAAMFSGLTSSASADGTRTTVADVATVDKGLSYKGAHLDNAGVPMANLKCISPDGRYRRDGTKLYSGPYKPKHRVAPGDLVMANTDLTQAGAVIGSPALIPRSRFDAGGIISHHLFAIRVADDAVRHFLYWLFRSEAFRAYARGVASGTTVLGFRPQDLLNFEFELPSTNRLRLFAMRAATTSALAERLSASNERLADLRDLLLPKLVTGQIDVSHIDLDAIEAEVA